MEKVVCPVCLKELGCALIESALEELRYLAKLDECTMYVFQVILAGNPPPKPESMQRYWEEDTSALIDIFRIEVSHDALMSRIEPLLREYEDNYPNLMRQFEKTHEILNIKQLKNEKIRQAKKKAAQSRPQ